MKRLNLKSLHLNLNLIAIVLIALGLILGYPSIKQYWQGRSSQNVQSSKVVFANRPVKPTPEPRVAGLANRIVVKSLRIDLPVLYGQYHSTSKTWDLSSDKAQFASLSKLNNNKTGNTLIYGHNNKQVFAKLNQIKSGAEALVYTDNGHVFKYVYKSSVETSPNDASVFYYQGPPMLTLQTCSGIWYQNRQLFSFDFVGVK